MASAKTYLDFIANCEGGMQSGVSPLLVAKNQIAFGLNLSLRGGYITHRPPIQKKNLNYNGDTALQQIVENGLWQGGGYYRPDFGTESLIAQIAGHLILFTEQGNGGTWNVTDVSIPNDLNNASTTQVWMDQMEKWMGVWDGSSTLPIFFDGTMSRRSYGPSVVLGITALTFTPPEIGATIQLTLTAPYTGPFNVPILLNGEFYQPVENPSAIYTAVLTNVSDSGATQVSGSAVSVIPGNAGIIQRNQQLLSSIFPPGTPIQFVFSSLLPNIPPGTILTIPDSLGFSFSFVVDSVFGTVVEGLAYNCHTTVSMVSPIYFNVGALAQISGSIAPTVTIGNTVGNFSVPAVGSDVTVELTAPYSGAADQPVWINGEEYLISQSPAVAPGDLLTVINLTDTSGSGQYPVSVTAPAELLSVPELPAGRMGAYGMGRQWLCLIDGISYIAGDIVGGASGTPANDYRDAVLKTTENDFLAGGGTFRLPGTGDIITAMVFPPILDTSLGQGELIISTPFSMFSNNSPVDRTTWETITSPLQTESLKDNGALAQNSTILVNSDTFFRSYVGIGSLVLARRSFLGWGNKPISNEMQRILNKDNPSLLPYGSAITYDNRYLSSCSPNNSSSGVFHVGLISLNFDLISSLRANQPPAWESVWTGINSLQVISGRVNGSKRAFAFTYNIDTRKIELYELLQEITNSYQDNDSIPILWIFETPVLFNSDIKPLPNLIQLSDGEFYISDVQGIVTIKVYYRPDFYPCWQLWNTQTVCVDATGQYAQEGYRMRLGLGTPDSTPAETGNNRPLNVGNFFQFRVEVTGSCKWHGLKVSATEFPQPAFALVDTPTQCQAIDCEVPDDLRLYSLQGFPAEAPSTVPPIYTFFNQAVFFSGICSTGSLSFTGSLPNWITIDSANNRVIGAAGVIGGTTQAEANANAQLALDQFVSANLANGNLSCSGMGSCPGDDTNAYAVSGYVDGVIANTTGSAPAGGEITWDGTFPILDNSGSKPCFWAAINQATGVMLVNGKRSFCADVYFDSGSNTWKLEVWDDKNNMLWQGQKSTGTTPTGVYPSTGAGTDGNSPASLTVVQNGSNTPDLASFCEQD